jgi:hypothetical protein
MNQGPRVGEPTATCTDVPELHSNLFLGLRLLTEQGEGAVTIS